MDLTPGSETGPPLAEEAVPVTAGERDLRSRDIDVAKVERYAVLVAVKRALEGLLKELEAPIGATEQDVLTAFERAGVAALCVSPEAKVTVEVSTSALGERGGSLFVLAGDVFPLRSEELVTARRVAPASLLWGFALDGDMERACDVLEAQGLGEYVKRAFNVTSLSAFLRERQRNGEDPLEGLEAGIRAETRWRLSVTKSKRAGMARRPTPMEATHGED